MADKAAKAESRMIFEVLKPATGERITARLGRLVVSGRQVTQTPNFLGVATRGAVPHLTPDNVSQYKPFQGVYLALEDFVEKYPRAPPSTPAIYETPSDGRPRLHAFTALPSEVVSILAPRRYPAATAKMGNTKDSISIYTSTGVQQLTTTEYNTAITALQPDIAIPMADLNYDAAPPSSKRAVRLAERSEDWIRQLSRTLPLEMLRQARTSLFAPILPVPYDIQWQYLNTLSELSPIFSGLAVYDTTVLPALIDYSCLLPLPRLSLSPAPTPHAVLSDVASGVDLFLLPFINATSESGVALTFAFPPPESRGSPSPLGIDLSQPEHAASFVPLVEGCPCYACTSHHRAFLRHLLDAREMLAWTLLQIHNHATLQAFFTGVRAALDDGTFGTVREDFARAYAPELPVGQGVRPRQRGYHVKSRGGDAKINQPAWGSLAKRMGGTEGDGAGASAAGAVRPPETTVGELGRTRSAEATGKESGRE